jgi:hypothetical protein
VPFIATSNTPDTPIAWSVVGNILNIGGDEYDLLDDTTYPDIAALVTAINGNSKVTAITFDDANDIYKICTRYVLGASPAHLHNDTGSFPANGVYSDRTNSPYFPYESRAFFITNLAAFLLAGIPQSTDFNVQNRYVPYGGDSINSGTACDWQAAFALLGEPLGDDYYHCPGYAAGLKFWIRQYENGVVFLNWDDSTNLVISANYLAGRSPWYPMLNNGAADRTILRPGFDCTSKTTITVPPKHGDIAFWSLS